MCSSLVETIKKGKRINYLPFLTCLRGVRIIIEVSLGVLMLNKFLPTTCYFHHDHRRHSTCILTLLATVMYVASCDRLWPVHTFSPYLRRQSGPLFDDMSVQLGPTLEKDKRKGVALWSLKLLDRSSIYLLGHKLN